MVAANAVPSTASLAEVLAARARRTPTSRLVIDAVGGGAIVFAALWARPFGWFALIGAGTCLAAYGAWALAERRLESDAPLSDRKVWLLDLVQGIATPFGLAGFMALLFGALAIAIGPVKS